MQLKVLLLIIFVGLMNVDRDAHAFSFLNSRKWALRILFGHLIFSIYSSLRLPLEWKVLRMWGPEVLPKNLC